MVIEGASREEMEKALAEFCMDNTWTRTDMKALKQPPQRTMMHYPDYPTPLQEIDFGVKFDMLNYDGQGPFIRIKSTTDFQTIVEHRMANPLSFNDDGYHVPIVNLHTGHVFHMVKIKPCRVVKEVVVGGPRHPLDMD
jgi:hypothetical protein